jgi:hypothetical protein
VKVAVGMEEAGEVERVRVGAGEVGAGVGAGQGAGRVRGAEVVVGGVVGMVAGEEGGPGEEGWEVVVEVGRGVGVMAVTAGEMRN